jgi:hypothetical protein
LAVVALVALSGGVAGFAVMRSTFEEAVSQNMRLTATTSATSLANTVEISLWFPRTIATRPTAAQALKQLGRTPGDTAATEYLQRLADSF